MFNFYGPTVDPISKCIVSTLSTYLWYPIDEKHITDGE